MTSSTNLKPIFEAVRRILGRGLRSPEVSALDQAFDCGLGDEQACTLSVPQHIGPAGIALIKQFEGCARLRTDGLVEAYPDPGTGGDPWTIGWGATGKNIAPGTVWTRKECDDRLERDLIRYASDVTKALDGSPTSQAQFDAMVSFHYNTGAIGRATLTKRHKAADYQGSLAEFARWNRAGGRVLKGLSRRRAAEAKLYASNGASG